MHGATLDSIRPYITEIIYCGNELENVLREYQKFGTQLREIVENNLANLTSESHLYEKVGLSKFTDQTNRRT